MNAIIQKRTAKRSRMLLSAVLEDAAGQHEVRIRDVSTEGALLEVSASPSVEEQVQLTCGDSTLAGRVVWVDGSWCGIEFLEPLKGSLVDHLGNRLKVSAPRAYRHDSMLTEDERAEVTNRAIRIRSLH